MARPGMVRIDGLGEVEWTTSEEVRAQDRWLNRVLQRLAGPKWPTVSPKPLKSEIPSF